MRPAHLALLGLLLLAPCTFSQQSLEPTADATAQQGAPAVAFGQSPNLDAGKLGNFPGAFNRAYLQFDLASIPGSWLLHAATLELTAFGGIGAGCSELPLHRILAPWGETTLTWNSAPPHDATPVATACLSQVGIVSLWDVTSLVDGWRQGTFPNFGLVIRHTQDPGPGSGPGAIIFAESRESATPSLRPHLNLDFAFSTFGNGCAGAGNAPPVIGIAGGAPSPGNMSFQITLASTLGGSPALLMLGQSDSSWNGLSLPFDLSSTGLPEGCELLVSPDQQMAVTTGGSGAGGGVAAVSLPIPASSSLEGLVFFAQWAIVDPAGGAAGVVVSNAARIRIGSAGAAVPLSIPAQTLPGAVVGLPYTATLQVIGGQSPITWSLTLGSLPPGLTLDGATGQISGTATAAGNFSFTIQATDSSQPPVNATAQLTLLVTAGNSAAWSPLALANPPNMGRSSGAAVYDPDHDRLIITHGSNGNTLSLNSTLELTLTPGAESLQDISTAVAPAPPLLPPPPRWGGTAVYDPLLKRLLLFGGEQTSDPSGNSVFPHIEHNDVWALTLGPQTGTWVALSPGGTSPMGRVGHTAVFDTANNRMIVFGGGTDPGTSDPTATQDLFVLDFNSGPDGTWSVLTAGGPVPPALMFHAAIVDGAHQRMLVFGGQAGSIFNPGAKSNQVWSLDLNPVSPTWSQLTPGGSLPAPRMDHAAIYDPQGHRMVIFGGLASGPLNDVFTLDLGSPGAESWMQVTPAGTPPSPRSDHTFAWDSLRGRLVTWSGFPFWPNTPFLDAFALSLP